MSCDDPVWAVSAREAMLEALKAVLEGIDGVRFVNRQAITGAMVADSQLPAILIDELKTEYGWVDRHGERSATLRCTVMLDLQVQVKRRGKAQRGPQRDASTIRELFAHVVIHTLANNPTLSVQLDGEAEAQDHARDVLGRLPTVQYGMGDGASSQALITLSIDVGDHFDGRVKTTWSQLIAELGGEPVSHDF